MKHLEYIVMAFAAALLATSCSRDDYLVEDGGDTPAPGQTQTYTFTVSPDIVMEGDAKTRSDETDAEKPTRCFMQVLGNGVLSKIENGEQNENGSFVFSVQLPSNTVYTFMFWADNGGGEAPTDLKAVQYTPGTVAFAARVEGLPENMIDTEVKLKHIVTKITLQHNGVNTFSPKVGDVMTITLPCATTYDISEETVSGNETHEFTHTFSESTPMTEATDICNFYVLSPSNANNNIDISFRDFGLTISNISMPADTHITLSGDFSSENEKWEISDIAREEAFQSCFYNENGTPKGEPMGSHYDFYTDQSTLQRFFDEIFGMPKGSYNNISLFGQTISSIDNPDNYMGHITFYIDNTTFQIYYGEMYSTMPNTFEVPAFEKDW